MCQSVTTGTTLRGVVCVDQSLEELVSDLEYLQLGESSYSFIVDTSTRVIYHPYNQNPSTVMDAPRFAYLDTLEVGSGVDTMLEQIKRYKLVYSDAEKLRP